MIWIADILTLRKTCRERKAECVGAEYELEQHKKQMEKIFASIDQLYSLPAGDGYHYAGIQNGL